MRRVRYILIVSFASLVLLEVGLQLAALTTCWWFGPSVRASNEAGRSVLCIGDSFTFGDGASDASRSYPSCLERELQRLGHAVRVTNAGFPGRDSYNVARDIDRWVVDSGAEVVCVLVGVNDRWNRPGTVESLAPVDDGRFRWRLRTWRLLKWALQPAREAHSPSKASPDRIRVVRGLLERAGVEFRPARRVGPESEVAVTAQREFWNAVRAQRLDAARSIARRAIEQAPDDPVLQALAARGYLESGDRAAAATVIAEQRRAYEASPSANGAAQLIESLWLSGDLRGTLAFGHHAVARFDDVRQIWFYLGLAARRCEPDYAWEAYRRQVELMSLDAVGDADQLAEFAVETGQRGDVPAALGILVASALLRDDLTGAQNVAALRLRPAFDPQVFDRIVEPIEGDRARRLTMRLRRELAGSSGREYLTAYEHNLRLIVERCRARGAVPVLVGYPTRQDIEVVQRRVAESESIEFVDAAAAFARELEVRSRDELFVADGHCNDAGYAILAGEAASAVKNALD